MIQNEAYGSNTQAYKIYAYAVGFQVRKRNLKKGDDGVMRYVMWS